MLLLHLNKVAPMEFVEVLFLKPFGGFDADLERKR